MSRRLTVACLLAGIVWACTARGAPQTFNTALPVAQCEFVFRGQFVYRKASGDPGTADRKLEVLTGASVLGYGVTSNLAVFGVLPWRDKSLEATTGGGQRPTREINGLGDGRLFGRYTVYRHDAPGRTFRIAPFLGMELPTGDDNERDSSGTLPVPLQPGSGSWDPFGGIVLTYQTLAYQTDAQASYQINTEANDFAFGDQARLDASLQYRLWPRRLGAGVPGFLYGVVEGNLIYQGKNENRGEKDANSGGTSLFLSPGMQYVTRRWILEAIVQAPAAQDLNGAALEDDFTVRAGFRLNF